ncbi:hypothetical protein BX281_0804 [Streptomyces sp. Ag82_O1-15]|uniref:hypothetical protein n=1 Tax=Streptomyces sp. Ag82_O1-15 TaxID=1938855 RepID=UPI000BB10423|nr:hypothetical protein [Streptomyces sp. Ag82_O1-15]PBC93048.1 hypothetical protein BX281_0804 [Streptomyces sp. Ag82_O1-15]
MLAQLPLVYLLLIAAFATFVLCFVVDRWMKVRKLTLFVLVVSLCCCLGMIAVGAFQPAHWNSRQMLVMYSFVWIGLAAGLIPPRKLFLEYGEEWRRGVKRDAYAYPVRYQVVMYVSVGVMCLLAFVLAT